MLPMQAQISTVVFQDDFASNTIDPAKYTPDAPFFEGGKGDIHAEARNGTIEFVGTTTQQWWSGGTLEIAGTYNATEATPVTISIDRVAEAGVGTASRSALWILDETETQYVLFADVRAEGGWRFNRKIGENGDVPTGSGTDIGPFNGGTFDDAGLHKMKMVADGKTVKLYLDGILGTEVKFPFAKVKFHFGSYARANNDTAATTWDNLKIETLRPTSVVFADDFASNSIDPAKYQPDAPFFEGGKGDIHAEARGGAIEFVGTTTQQWWSGATLRVVPTFSASKDTPVQISIDRVREAGVGTASRSALWILDETGSKYVLFADVRGEGGWRFNRKIGENGDVPTGSGTDIAAFNGGNFDDGALHKMQILADGQTVKLILDGNVGAEVKFPVSKVQFHFGSYARANNDTAATTWDNLKIETVIRQKTVVFTDDFASNAIDPARYRPEAPFFEGGKGDIHAEARNGTVEFVGTTTQQWWSGGTLALVQKFAPSEQEVITLSIDRVAEAGVGTASRSALWILDETLTKYVLFADVRGEGGWRYNRKIGENGDVPTGGGNNMAAFDGGTFDDGKLHRMSMIADGKTVKLLIDGVQGAEVKFPFSPVVFAFGAYARANNDTAATTWDNLTIETAGSAAFVPASTSVRKGGLSGELAVRLPFGANAQSAVNMRVVTSDPNIILPEGGTAGVLNLVFPAGGSNIQTFRARGVNFGGANLSLEGDIPAANQLSVAVISGPGVVLEEAFGGSSLDAAKWTASARSFEVGTGTYTTTVGGGVLEFGGSTETDFWGGASVISKNPFTATRELNLVVEVDRALLESGGTSARSGVYLTTADHTKYVFFSHNFPENGWTVNVNPGNPTGGGTVQAAFNANLNDGNPHKMKMVANGSTVAVYLDGILGGEFEFPVSTGIHVELAGYARATGDSLVARFDNVRAEYVVPCLTASPASSVLTVAETGRQVQVTVPTLLHDAAPATVTVRSLNPSVAVPAGASGGTLVLTFAAGASDTQTFAIQPVGRGNTTFEITSSPAACVSGAVAVEVVAVPEVVLTDDFSAAAIDASKWVEDATPFDSGAATAESGVKVENGQAKFTITAESSLWPGLGLFTKSTYNVTRTTPATFEIDRAKLEFDLTTGTGAEQRTGVYVKSGANFVFFNDYVAHDGRNYGWRYNKVTGAADDDALGVGVNIAAFDGGNADDRGNHRLKIVANGVSAKLFLDGVLGAEVPFPFAQGLTFGFAAYVDEAGNVVRGFFDNAKISAGESAVQAPSQLTIARSGASVVISWTGSGTLQSADSATGPYTDVAGATTSPRTVAADAARKFYRVRQ